MAPPTRRRPATAASMQIQGRRATDAMMPDAEGRHAGRPSASSLRIAASADASMCNRDAFSFMWLNFPVETVSTVSKYCFASETICPTVITRGWASLSEAYGEYESTSGALRALTPANSFSNAPGAWDFMQNGD